MLGKKVREALLDQVRAVFNKNTDYQDPEVFHYVVEYLARLDFRRLGYTTDFNKLDCLTAEAFEVIATELRRLEELKRERDARRSKLRKGRV